LPDKIALCTTAQFLDNLDNIIKILEKHKKSVFLIKGKHSSKDGRF